MATVTISRGAQALGDTFSYAAASDVDGAVRRDPTLAAAKVGTLSTRSSDTAGTLTMNSGHGFTDAQVIDIYWATGQCTKAVIGTVATNSVPFTGAGGDVLPAQGTAITAMVVRTENLAFVDGDLEALLVGAFETGTPSRASVAACSVTFFDADDNVVGRALVRAGTTDPRHYIWDADSGVAVPVSADVAYVNITHGDSGASRVVKVLALPD